MDLRRWRGIYRMEGNMRSSVEFGFPAICKTEKFNPGKGFLLTEIHQGCKSSVRSPSWPLSAPPPFSSGRDGSLLCEFGRRQKHMHSPVCLSICLRLELACCGLASVLCFKNDLPWVVQQHLLGPISFPVWA